jgi:hypothetical protein
MRKLLMTAGCLLLAATLAWAADRDRHANYTDPSAADKGTQTLCKGFYGEDDNLTPCQDWCQQWIEAHEGASCACGDEKCAQDEIH